jgi:hypothetical protein
MSKRSTQSQAVNNLSSAVRPTHTFAIVSLLEESLGCLCAIIKQRPEQGLKNITTEAQKLFVQQTSINRMFVSLDIHSVRHKEFVPHGKTVKRESYVHELQNL